jgi:hypothetical protein
VLLIMVSYETDRRGDDDAENVQPTEPYLAQVEWRKDAGLRRLYFYAFIICIASATTGYDA